jgi:BirA family biotin operon repressor/biotin-[acetyl-CoA-carboxylase] ligase
MSKHLPDLRFEPTEWFERLESTNTHLQQMFRKNQELANATVLATREQTGGRGRNNRPWLSTAGKDLAFSFLLRSQMPSDNLVALPLVVGVGLAEALESLGLDPYLKWPNDLLVSGKKICGILAEQVHNVQASPTAVIIGIGVNINMKPQEAKKIDQPTTSLYIEKGEVFSIDEVLSIILEHLAHWIGRWQREGFSAISPAWLGRCRMYGQEIRVTDTSGKVTHGTMSGLGPQGQLLVTDAFGTIQTIWSGDVFRTT